MPTVNENRAKWDGEYDWADGGAEWSAAWGSTSNQWQATLLPRLRPYLPAHRIVEIGPGYGRWTQFLLDHCDAYVGVDLSGRCIEHCRQRFADRCEARFVVNDGEHLPGVADGSVDLCFSFDSLVHVEADVVANYLAEVARVLGPDGVAFLHHSNLGDAGRTDGGLAALIHRVGDRARRAVYGSQTLRRLANRTTSEKARKRLAPFGWRAESGSAEAVVRECRRFALCCISQELINWPGHSRLIDCISVLVPRTSQRAHQGVVVPNPDFAGEARSAARRALLYPTAEVPGPLSAVGSPAQGR